MKIMRFGTMKQFISEIPNKKELERLSIKDLIIVATHKRIMGISFKNHLIDYILKFKTIGW